MRLNDDTHSCCNIGSVARAVVASSRCEQHDEGDQVHKRLYTGADQLLEQLHSNLQNTTFQSTFIHIIKCKLINHSDARQPTSLINTLNRISVFIFRSLQEIKFNKDISIKSINGHCWSISVTAANINRN